MNRNSILSLLLALICLAATSACNHSNADATPVSGPNVSNTQAPDSNPPKPSLTDQEKALATQVAVQYILNQESIPWGDKMSGIQDCQQFNAAVAKTNINIGPLDGGSFSSHVSSSTCDDSNHFGAFVSVDVNFTNFPVSISSKAQPIFNGAYHVDYSFSDGEYRLIVSSSNLTVDGTPFSFEKMGDDSTSEPGAQCSGLVQVKGVQCKVTSDCDSCQFSS